MVIYQRWWTWDPVAFGEKIPTAVFPSFFNSYQFSQYISLFLNFPKHVADSRGMWPMSDCFQVFFCPYFPHLPHVGSGAAGEIWKINIPRIPGGSVAIFQRKTLMGRKSFRDSSISILSSTFCWRLKLLTSAIWSGLQGGDSAVFRSNLA